ncbi:MAG: hypothetical protein JWR16_1888, partial [Nevskia sp.]|nr:hypothetical protein [Nevskia sp.]
RLHTAGVTGSSPVPSTNSIMQLRDLVGLLKIVALTIFCLPIQHLVLS